MQLACVVPASIVVLLASSGIGRRDSELGSNLAEGALRRWKPKLALEKRRLGGVPVRAREVESLCGINELLCLLHYACKVGKHDFSFLSDAHGDGA